MENLYTNIFARIETLSQTKQSVIIVIDGKTASGKTTLAKTIQKKFDATIIPMDDFFLPEHLRTPMRFKEPGGNIHYEYFKDSVSDQLRHKEITYQPFDCHKMAFRSAQTERLKPVIIIEGSYAMHPYFGRYYDLSIFLDMDPQTQVTRLIQRNGEDGAQLFINRWVGLENTYFEAFAVKHNADFVIKIT